MIRRGRPEIPATAAGGTWFPRTAICARSRTTRRRRFDRNLGGARVHHHDLRGVYQRPDRSPRVGAGLAASHAASDSLPRIRWCCSPAASRWSWRAARWAPSWRGAQDSGRQPSSLAVHHSVSGLAFCGWPVRGLAAIARPGPLSGDQSQQFILLCADGDPRPARAGWSGRAGPGHSSG